MKKLLFLFALTIFLSACSDDPNALRMDQEDILQEYFTDNNITDVIEAEGSGVYYRITEEGNGEDFPNVNSTIRTFYKGYLLEDGSVFDERVEGEDDYLQISLNQMIFGWIVALPNFSKGAKGELFIPAHAGYGSSERPGIPENSIIVFEVHLVNVF